MTRIVFRTLSLAVLICLCSPVLVAQVATVTWVHLHSGDPIPPNALIGGTDYDPHLANPRSTLWVCRVSDHGGLIPGKLLNNSCNASWNGGGHGYADFEVATLSGGMGHWATYDPALTGQMLVGGQENGTSLFVCHANYIHTLDIFNKDHDSGIHPGKLVGDKCVIEWGGMEKWLDQYVQVFYLTPAPGQPARAIPRPEGATSRPAHGAVHFCNGPGQIDTFMTGPASGLPGSVTVTNLRTGATNTQQVSVTGNPATGATAVVSACASTGIRCTLTGFTSVKLCGGPSVWRLNTVGFTLTATDFNSD
jgi:hypothetical protein